MTSQGLGLQAQDAAGDAKSAAGDVSGSAKSASGDVTASAKSAVGDAKGAAQSAGRQVDQATPDLSGIFDDILDKVCPSRIASAFLCALLTMLMCILVVNPQVRLSVSFVDDQLVLQLSLLHSVRS